MLPILHRLMGPAPTKAGVGWTRNLSEGGMCVELAEGLQPQSSLRVLLQTDRGSIEVEAQVVWVGEPDPAGGGIPHGLAFTQIAPEQRQTLRDLLGFARDRRHAGVRLPSDLRITCQHKDQAGPALQGWTGNVSRGGLLLRLPEALPPGTMLEVTLHIAGEPLTVEGTIVWLEPPWERAPGEAIRHGFRFTALSWTSLLALGLALVGAQ